MWQEWRTHVCQTQYFLASSALENVIRVHQRSASKISWRNNLPWRVSHISLGSKLFQAETTGEQQSGMHPKPLNLKEVVLQMKDSSSERKGLIKSLTFLPTFVQTVVEFVLLVLVSQTTLDRACKKTSASWSSYARNSHHQIINHCSDLTIGLIAVFTIKLQFCSVP